MNIKDHLRIICKDIVSNFYKGRKVFLLNDIYPPYEEELVGWNVIPLKGDIDKIDEYLK